VSLWLALTLVTLLVAADRATPQLARMGQNSDLAAYPWIYLRDGRPPTAGESVVELIAVGDVMLGRAVAGIADPLAQVAPWLATADLTLGNLESPIVRDGIQRSAEPGEPQPIILKAPITAVSNLTTAGFDLLGLANNHSLDYGPAGLIETGRRLEQAGITPIGAGPHAAAVPPVAWRTIGGVRLAFLAFNDVREPDPVGDLHRRDGGWTRCDWDPATAVEAVAAARTESDAVVVSVHWGYEFQPVADPAQVAMVEALFAAGADLVVGHHPHVVQGTLVSDGRFAAYSLGNLIFDQEQGDTTQGLALRALFDAQGLRAVQALPLRAGPRPRLMTPAESGPLLARIAPPPQWLNFTCQQDNCEPETVDGEPAAAGIFWSGTLDLTGDGQPERVRRAAEQVTVYQGADLVWQSPREWQVVDVALGDPNDDGRGELLLALWRPDSAGYLRSQPYIVGHRGGVYKVLWGGRPLVYPIREVELGDVDGDGRQELVVLEEQKETQTVAIWRWQGWSFSLMWRSPPGRYHTLLLVPQTDSRASIRVARN
jgi:poly-gamma-glutamate synthesis protein (capsule biosynthesis protein)